MVGEFWLSDAQWAAIEPLLPTNQLGARRTDDRRVISAIVHMLKKWRTLAGCPDLLWPADHDLQPLPPLVAARHLGRSVHGHGGGDAWWTSPDRQHHGQGASVRRGRKRGADTQAIARSRGGRGTKLHLVTDGGRVLSFLVAPGHRGDAPVAQRLLEHLPPAKCLLADTAYDSDQLRSFLLARATTPVIPNNPTRKHVHPFDRPLYKACNAIERRVSHLKDWRRIHTRYDKLATNYASAIAIACANLLVLNESRA